MNLGMTTSKMEPGFPIGTCGSGRKTPQGSLIERSAFAAQKWQPAPLRGARLRRHETDIADRRLGAAEWWIGTAG
jgi:hypothetical protein